MTIVIKETYEAEVAIEEALKAIEEAMATTATKDKLGNPNIPA